MTCLEGKLDVNKVEMREQGACLENKMDAQGTQMKREINNLENKLETKMNKNNSISGVQLGAQIKLSIY